MPINRHLPQYVTPMAGSKARKATIKLVPRA